MGALQEYLTRHEIEPLQLSAEAGVRYLTVYNATKGNPISAEHAQKIRVALHRLTGEVYTGTLAVIQPTVDEAPTIPIKRIYKLK